MQYIMTMYAFNLFIFTQCEIWACLVEHLAGIEKRHT